MLSPLRLALSLLLTVLATPCLASDLPEAVREALRTARIAESAVAIIVQPVDASPALIAHNAEHAMNPASVMKLLTTYAALDLLGPAWTWQTTAWSDALAVDGRLGGNLYLKGSGDPRFAIEHLNALLRQLRVRGIRHIAGDIIIDRSAFAVPEIDPGAFDDQPMRPYNVSPNAFLLNFHSLQFSLQANAGTVQLWQETPSEGLRLDNRLRATAGPCTSDWKDQLNIRLINETAGPHLLFEGSLASSCGEKTLALAPLTASAYVDGLIRAQWRELGGTLDGRIDDGSLPPGARQLARHESPPLADAIRDINKFSNNVMARQLFLCLGNDSAPATTERARQRIADWLSRRGIAAPELVIDNGAGLSRTARISAGSLNRLLLDAWRHPAMPELIASLPIVGIDGTMKKRLKGSPLAGRAHIKSGTLEGVKSAAGYGQDAAGRRYTVIFLINDPRAAAGSPALDALLRWLGEQGHSRSTARNG
ncbi:MAG: D-alanyl-D-alanine carboxypeptidase/D-alanyl-D-alanine-endopeptidase [Dechloromonas sp.]|nr:D-alanyl-D-alanine carboxypeptidase/D-alanyl-D-alanine-endopeptidase [Dechloromonas sp.]